MECNDLYFSLFPLIFLNVLLVGRMETTVGIVRRKNISKLRQGLEISIKKVIRKLGNCFFLSDSFLFLQTSFSASLSPLRCMETQDLHDLQF